MRFDGYFLLSDYLQLPNLHSRSFALARWDLRERLFALNESQPEHFSRSLHRGLILFAWAVWIYRLVVFLGIAALVYHFVIKAVGIFLFLIEIGWFIWLPLRMELLAWKKRWPAIRHSPHARRSMVFASVLTALFLLPWPTRVGTSAMLQPAQQVVMYGAPHAQVRALPVHNGQYVEANTLLMELTSPELLLRTEQSAERQQKLAWQTAAAGFNPETRKDWQVLDQQLAGAVAEQATVHADAQQYSFHAGYPGVLQDIDPDLRPGQWVSNREMLGRLVVTEAWKAVTYVDEDDIHRLSVGDRALFMADGLAGPNVHLHISNIDKQGSTTLNEGELASLFGGHVAVREKNGQLFPERTYYRVLFSVDSSEDIRQHSWRGRVTIAGEWEAPGLRFLKTAIAVFRREAGF
jgi:putative peptide zinc metalloprotease protein